MILGLLSHENLTGYEIKKRMDGSLNFFGGASYGSIYPTLNDLSTLLVMEKNLLHHLQEDSTHEYYLLTCRFGIKTYRAYLEWGEEARNYLSEHDQEEN